MPDQWRDHIRARLASLRLAPAREAEIVEELSQHLDERYEELRQGGATEEQAQRMAVDELLEADALANEMRSLRQTRVSSFESPHARGASASSWGLAAQSA